MFLLFACSVAHVRIDYTIPMQANFSNFNGCSKRGKFDAIILQG